MKRVRHTAKARDRVLHIETDLGIINITVGLHDVDGRRVEHIEIIPDGDRFAGRPVVTWDGAWSPLGQQPPVGRLIEARDVD